MNPVTRLVAHLVGKACVKLHYKQCLDIYSLCSQHQPERYLKTQRKAAIPTGIRWQVWRRDNFSCVYCQDGTTYLTLDHVVPEAHGGKVEVDNLVTACTKCNSRKGSRNFNTFIHSKWLKTRIQRVHQRSLTMQARPQRASPQVKEMRSRIARATGREPSLKNIGWAGSFGESKSKQTYQDFLDSLTQKTSKK